MKPPLISQLKHDRRTFVLLALLASLAVYVSLAAADGADSWCRGNSPKKVCPKVNPQDGATVIGTVEVSASFTDDTAVSSVQFLVDDAILGPLDTAPPFTAKWDTTNVSNGSHKLAAVAFDKAGGNAASINNVTVNNPVPDTTPPVVAFSAPAAGATVSQQVSVDATASDNVAVAGVRFKLDGADMGEDVSAPYSYPWDTTKIANGDHTMTAVARDAAGNTATATRSFKVSNSSATATPTPTPPSSSPSGYSQAVLSDSPAAYWRLGDASGSSATDASGNGRVGSYEGSPSLGSAGALSGDSNTAVGFNGSSQYMSAPYAGGLNGSSFSVEAWAYVTGGQGSFRSVVTSRDDSSSFTRGYVLYAGAENTWQFWVGNGNPIGWVQVWGPAITLNTWTHLVGTYDGSTARFYVNGALAASASTGFSPNTARPLRVGAGASERAADYLFPGRVDEAAVYGGALSSTRVQAHYSAGTGGGGGGVQPPQTSTPTPTPAPPGGDTSPPSVQVTAPSNGSVIGDKIYVAASASDNVGVAGVQFKLDGGSLGAEDTSAPYGLNWDTIGTANGSHQVIAVARDAAGNKSTSTSTVQVSNTTAPPAGEPSPIAGKNYHRVFRDDFTTLDIGQANTWAPREWWQQNPPAGAITNASGSVFLRSKRADGYPIIVMSTLNLSNRAASKAWRRGYFEARMRWTAGAGAWPGFWLMSKNHAVSAGSSYCSEFDIFEGQGTRPQEMSGALHRNTSNCNGLAADTQRGCWTKPAGSPNLSQWHTFSGVWTTTEVKWYVDGQLLCSQPVYDTTDQDMYLLFSMWTGGWWPENVIGPSTPDVLELEVDYVDVWQQ